MKKFSLIYLLLGLGALLFVTQKFLLPMVYNVAKSDAFMVDTKDQSSQYPISNEMTNFAFMHCNDYIKSELEPNASVTFGAKPLKAWTLGNYHYLINGEITVAGASNPAPQKYVCRIAYEKGEQQEGVQDFKNWSIEGIDGIEGL